MPQERINAITTHTLLDIVLPVGIAYLTKWGVIAIAFVPNKFARFECRRSITRTPFDSNDTLLFSCRYKTIAGKCCHKDRFSFLVRKDYGAETWGRGKKLVGKCHAKHQVSGYFCYFWES